MTMDVGRELERARAEDSARASSELDAMWRRLEPETVSAKPTLRRRLSEMPTPRRVGLVVGATLAVATIMLLALGGARGDLISGGLVLRYALAMVGLAVLAGAVFAVALRGAHEPRLGPRAWIVVALGVLVPLVLSLVPSVWQPAAGTTEPVIYGCPLIGGVLGIFAAVLAYFFQRSTTPTAVRVVASAAGGGVIAFAMLQLHCPADDVEHLVLGHASVGIILVVLAGIGLAIRGTARRS